MRTALAILFCSSSLLTAQGTPQPLPEVFRDAEQDWNLSWWGISGRSYFIEVSDDMQNWSFAPIIEPGNDEEIVWETGALSQRQFIRLTYTDQTAADLDAADFDADGLGNLQEISLHHTHPLKSDTDFDGLADGWEIANDLDPKDNGSINPVNGGNGDPDGDGSTNLDEQNSGTNPKSNQDFPVQLISVSRSGSGSTITPASNGGIPGTLSLSNSWTDDQSEENLSQELVPSFLASRLSSQMAFPDTPPEEEGAATISNLVNGNVSADGRFSVYTNNGITNAGGSLSQAKVWLKSPPSTNPREFRLLKMTRELSIPLNPSGGIAGQETASYSSIDVETFTIPANEELSNSVELLPEVGSASGSRKRTIVSLKEIGIKPADGMVGVVGDMIPSNQVVNPELHFVSPKKTDEIPNDYVVFEITGIDEKQIKDGDEAQVVTWVGGEAVPDAPLQRRVKRDQAEKTELRITTLQQHGSEEVAKVNVWVVWTATSVASLEDVRFIRDDDGATYGGSPLRQKHWRFTYKILPEGIVADGEDRPNFSGVNRTPVPGELKPHFFVEGRKADDATAKWDVSRKLEIVVYNESLIPKNKFPDRYIYRNQPAARDVALSFPQDPVEGNDDPGGADWLDEEVNPYQAYLGSGAGAGLSHNVGEISSRDGPVFRFENTTGVGGATLAEVANFREFARLEILSVKGPVNKSAWFRISDYTSWHHVMAGTFGQNPNSGQDVWEDAGSQSGEGVFEVP